MNSNQVAHAVYCTVYSKIYIKSNNEGKFFFGGTFNIVVGAQGSHGEGVPMPTVTSQRALGYMSGSFNVWSLY